MAKKRKSKKVREVEVYSNAASAKTTTPRGKETTIDYYQGFAGPGATKTKTKKDGSTIEKNINPNRAYRQITRVADKVGRNPEDSIFMKTGGMVNPNMRSMSVDVKSAYKSNKMRRSMPRGY